MKLLHFCVLLSSAFLVGCGTEIPPEPPAATAPAASAVPTTPAPAATPDMAAGAPTAPGTPQLPPAAPAAASPQPSPPPTVAPAAGATPELVPPALNPPQPPAAPPGLPPAPDMERVKAEKGVGVKGRSLDPHEGLIVTSAKALFTVRERAVFEIQIPEALKLYKATNDKGPKSHEEFMAQIIDANQIQLPQLPPGQRYVYDPEKEELMVERPAR